jgi:phage-related baseplate assembly protein
VDSEDPDLDLDDDQLQYESLDILPANTTNIPSTSKQLRSKNKNAIDDAIRRSIEKAYEKKQVAGKRQVVEKEARMERCGVIVSGENWKP